ncbi:MAG TPA: globin domain-containing protein [Streptosporangiaceae bacterium]|nr:globin domain-containing protein [Streptosporangiaceae bacterium]
MDIARLKSSFARIAMHGDEVPLHFYADLFLKHPETRPLFPVSMQAQRAHLVEALVTIVSAVDDVHDLTAFLRDLGRGHRKFGALAEHYGAVGDSLLATFAYFCGEAWDAELEADWRGAYELIASVMTGAAREDEERHPAWWAATVIAQERLAYDVTQLTVRTEPRLEYLPGQSVAIETPARPRLWRYYSMANAPRPDATLDFHIRLIDGGAVSMALTAGTVVGAELRLGPPAGALTLDAGSGRDVLMVAGSTGLAPLKAMLEQLATLAKPPRAHLFFGSRTADGLYDLTVLEKLAAENSWLTVVPVVSSGGPGPGRTGPLPDVVSEYASWSGHDVYLAGPTGMVRDSAARLAADGVPVVQIHVEDFGWSEP